MLSSQLHRMARPLNLLLRCLLFLLACAPALAAELPLPDEPTLELPAIGASQLRVLSPTVLELSLITTKAPDPAPVGRWNFVSTNGDLHLPDAKQFRVTVGGQEIPVQKVGFKRHVVYAPLKARDLRIGNWLYLVLSRAVPENQTVEVRNPDARLWPAAAPLKAVSAPNRWSPVLHVNQTGYLPSASKKAMVGYYLGSLGELDLGGDMSFDLVEASTFKSVHQGRLTQRLDRGFSYGCYQKVLEADFTSFSTPGQYRLQVPGLGVSYSFRIDAGTPATYARAYALGLYHQRCGTSNALPFTRFTHGPCHVLPAAIPLPETNFPVTWRVLAEKNDDAAKNPRHTAPRMTNNATSLYPFIKRGKIDVSGGHHDAGDYSKYTINSAGLIHHLVFAADVFDGVGDLDNLGLPESGDGKSDLLQEAKWEADFLAKMQDEDGGFYFLVYPRDREYESDVTSDRGDSQVVWPKTTASTAAAVAALAQCSSSPRFRKQFPEAAALYLRKAQAGWAFLEKAITKHGKDRAYQKITHYGNEFMHDDELAWAACEMFLATGEQAFQKKLLEWFNPGDANTRKWGWWRLYDAYGCAIRSYAFAVKAGKMKADQLDLPFRSKAEVEIITAAEDQLHRARDSAYGTSFPNETKRFRGGGWYFSADAAFDLAVASALDFPAQNDPRDKFAEAILTNLNYENGCNPVNVSFMTGLGWNRPRIVVHQNALNFRQKLPPSGLPIGNIQAGFGWLDLYQHELGNLTFPSAGRDDDPYPLYDRWGDTWNVSTEFVVLNQARGLAVSAFLMAKTPLKTQPWKFASAQIAGLPSSLAVRKPARASVKVPGLDLGAARIVWESRDQEPAFATNYAVTLTNSGPAWVECEVQMPDGRRAFAVSNCNGASTGR